MVHPCGTLDGHVDALRAGLRRLEAAGCIIRHDEARASATWRGYLAGTDDERADELVSALTEPGVDIVWLARGGSGAARIAQRVADRLRDVPPRALVGFSDATTLLNVLATQLSWITFHGPVVTTLGRGQPSCEPEAVLATLRGTRRTLSFAAAPKGQPSTAVDGRLVGGNLTVLASLAGTSLWPAGSDQIWLLEEVGEPPYRLDRCFQQLRAAGALEGARAVWVGDLGVTVEDRVACLSGLRADAGSVAVVEGAPAGHRGRLDLLPIGARVHLDPSVGRLEAREPWVYSRAPRVAS